MLDEVVDSDSFLIRLQIKVSLVSYYVFCTNNCDFSAALAMHSMNGVVLGSKQIVVRLHEPKQLRQEKLAQRFAGGHNNHPRSRSGATSPTASEGGDSFSAWPSPRGGYQSLGGSTYGGVATPERTRRSSGSYYNVCFMLNLRTELV